jgi:hypothetical protein
MQAGLDIRGMIGAVTPASAQNININHKFYLNICVSDITKKLACILFVTKEKLSLCNRPWRPIGF